MTETQRALESSTLAIFDGIKRRFPHSPPASSFVSAIIHDALLSMFDEVIIHRGSVNGFIHHWVSVSGIIVDPFYPCDTVRENVSVVDRFSLGVQ